MSRSRMGLCAAGFVALLAAPLAGCGGNLEAALNANAAMRIDVQVYKGPLALEPDVQWAQLLGYLDEIDNGLTNYATGAKGRLAEAFLRVLGPALRGVYLERKDLPAEQSSQKLIADLKRLNDAVGRPSLCGNSTDKTSMAELIKVLEALQNIEPKSVTWEKGKDIIESFQNEARDIYRLAFLLKNACDMQGVIRQKLAEAVSFDAVFRGSPPAMYRHRPSGTCVAADPSCDDMRKLMEDLRDNVKRTREDFRRVLSGIVEASARFKANAKYWAFEHTVFNSDNREVRILQTSLQLIGAEYNRKVVTGANALIAQLDYADRRELPISAMLADSNPTAFVNQVFWSDAAGSRLNNFEAFSEDYVEDRVRALEALYEDDTWAKVNTVYAGGSGEVRMALIKDDIGNWNLKNFDQDTTELVNTYKGVGLAALRSATDLATGGAGNIGNVQRLVGLANQLTLGSGGGSMPAESGQLMALRENLVTRLTALKSQVAKEADDLLVTIATLQPAAEAAETSRKELAAKVEQGKADSKVPGARLTTAEDADIESRVLQRLAEEREGEARTEADRQATVLKQLAVDMRSLKDAAASADAISARYNAAVGRYQALPGEAQAAVRALIASHRGLVDSLERGALGSKVDPPNASPAPAAPTPAATRAAQDAVRGGEAEDNLSKPPPSGAAALVEQLRSGALDLDTLVRRARATAGDGDAGLFDPRVALAADLRAAKETVRARARELVAAETLKLDAVRQQARVVVADLRQRRSDLQARFALLASSGAIPDTDRIRQVLSGFDAGTVRRLLPKGAGGGLSGLGESGAGALSRLGDGGTLSRLGEGLSGLRGRLGF